MEKDDFRVFYKQTAEKFGSLVAKIITVDKIQNYYNFSKSKALTYFEKEIKEGDKP